VAHVDLGPSALTGRQVQGLLLLFDQHPPVPQVLQRGPRLSALGSTCRTCSSTSAAKPPAWADQMISDAMATYWTNFAKRAIPMASACPTGRLQRRQSVSCISVNRSTRAGPERRGIEGLMPISPAAHSRRRAAARPRRRERRHTQDGIAAKGRFGGACKICPGRDGEVVQAP